MITEVFRRLHIGHSPEAVQDAVSPQAHEVFPERRRVPEAPPTLSQARIAFRAVHEAPSYDRGELISALNVLHESILTDTGVREEWRYSSGLVDALDAALKARENGDKAGEDEFLRRSDYYDSKLQDHYE